MDRPGPLGNRPVLAWLGALAIPAAATAASLLLDSRMSVAGVAMVYMLAVVIAAALPLGPAIASAVLSVISLNFFFVPPRGSLAVDSAESWWILLALIGLSLGLGAMLGSLRAKRAEADLGRKQAAELLRLSETMADAAGFDNMASAAATFFHEVTGRSSAIFLRDTEGASLIRFAQPDEASFDVRAASWTIENGRVLGAGSLDWPDLPLWCAPLAASGATGAVQVLMPTHVRVSASQALHWISLTRQAGLALERERAAAAAARAENSAKAEGARNILLASLSHDLRTPLAGIVGSASALRSQGAEMTEPQRARLLDNLEGEARDLALMADNILQIARLSQPQTELRTEWESIEDVLGAAVSRMRGRWPAAWIQLKVPHGLPPVRAEAGLLAQAIANLVDNATRHGGEHPHVVVQAGRGRDGIFVAVRDHGVGLPPGEPAELFTRWRSGEGIRAGGSGLGLAICHLAAEAHGGKVSAKRCEPGAEFRIDLPV
ncbi:MAG: ATP-binding protein, partial [Ramlibacter sp.]